MIIKKTIFAAICINLILGPLVECTFSKLVEKDVGSGSGSDSGSGMCEKKFGLTCDDYIEQWYKNSSNSGSMNCYRLQRDYEIDCSGCACNQTKVDDENDGDTTTTTTVLKTTTSTSSSTTTRDLDVDLSTTYVTDKPQKEFVLVGKTTVEGVDLLNNRKAQLLFEETLKVFHEADSVICQYSENTARRLRYLQRMLETERITVDYTLVYNNKISAETALQKTFTPTTQQDLATRLKEEDATVFSSVTVELTTPPAAVTERVVSTVAVTTNSPTTAAPNEFNWVIVVVICICAFVVLFIIGVTGYCLCRFHMRKAGSGASGVKWTTDDHDQAYYDEPYDDDVTNKRKSKKKYGRRDTYSAPPAKRVSSKKKRLSSKKSSGLSANSGYVDAFST